MRRWLPLLVIVCVFVGAITLAYRDKGPNPKSIGVVSDHGTALTSDRSTSRVLNLDNALAVALPKPAATLKPVSFETPDGRPGWVVRLPEVADFAGGLPLPTPAYGNGKIYVGGGFASTEFYAINASSGNMVWQTELADNGATSASIDHGNVACNTQSCSLMVMDANNGETRWKEWLGDPLVTQPTVSKGIIYASYPSQIYTSAGDETSSASLFATPTSAALIQGDSQGDTEQPSATYGSASGGGYELLCADMKHGKHIWKTSLPQEIISAPVVAGNHIYMACFDGTVSCMNAVTGAPIWSRHMRATSAPVVSDGRVVVTTRMDRDGEPYEGIVRLDAATGKSLDRSPLVLSPAPYLTNGGGDIAIDPAARRGLDALEGFDSLPTSLQVADAGGDDPFTVDSVIGAWAYEGSRVCVSANRIIDAQGAYLNAVRASDGKVLWREQAASRDSKPDNQLFSPPALGKRNVYLCSQTGDLVSLSQSSGRPCFMYRLGEPIESQPILAGGNIYIATSNGLLICIKTGDKDATGWSTWGGNSVHNKTN